MGHSVEPKKQPQFGRHSQNEDFVLEKSIFNNVFEKDIRRVFIYKKTERLAKALHLITPAFSESTSLRNRMDAIAVGLIDAAVVPLGGTRAALSRELLALSSVLSIARTGGLLSAMNADLIAREAQSLLQEVAAYEEPRLFLDEAPTLSDLAKNVSKQESVQNSHASTAVSKIAMERKQVRRTAEVDKGHVKDTASIPQTHIKDRREAILSVVRRKGSASIKDVSTLIRDVSEKTIQRELAALVETGVLTKKGERRWSTYSIV